MAMGIEMRRDEPAFDGIVLLGEVLRTEWKWWLSGAALSFLLASIFMTGWPEGLIPNTAYPYTYHGDGLSHSWMVQRLLEGWLFDNPRSGYPFGSSFLDYPGSDSGSYVVMKLLGYLVGEYQAVLNLYFLLGFAASFVASYCVLRSLGLVLPFSMAASTIFVFLPFHFLRIEHLFYTWYFVVPIFFYLAFGVFYSSRVNSSSRTGAGTIQSLAMAVGLMVLGSFGVYYALFGIIVICTAGVSAWARDGKLAGLLRALAMSLIVTVGVGLNVVPNVLNTQLRGGNPEVAARTPVDSEVYGLKLMQLLLPRLGHRDTRLANLTHQYSNAFPLVNENSTATLGVVGAAGFALVGVILLTRLAGGKVDSRLALLASIVLVLFLFGTVGGLGAVFASVVSPAIRGWNRISVFVAFGAIATFFLFSQIYLRRVVASLETRLMVWVGVVAIALVGVFDQTVPACLSCNEEIKSEFLGDKEFIGKIEDVLPRGAAIYQLPYMAFPEIPPLHRLSAYDLMPGFLHSNSLRWSYAGMKGRDGDLFFRSLAQQPIAKQIEVIKRLGFSGVYLDRRGFADGGQAVQGDLDKLLGGGPLLTRSDGEVLFYRVSPSRPAIEAGTDAKEIVRISGYLPATLQAVGDALGALPRQVGQMRNGYLASDGRAGFLLFGPYASMGAGVYQLVLNGKAAVPNRAYVDVVSGGGAVKHFMAPLSAPKDGSVGALAEGVIDLVVPVKDLEIRVFVTQQDSVELSGYELRHGADN